jgi:hypothetical protein
MRKSGLIVAAVAVMAVVGAAKANATEYSCSGALTGYVSARGQSGQEQVNVSVEINSNNQARISISASGLASVALYGTGVARVAHNGGEVSISATLTASNGATYNVSLQGTGSVASIALAGSDGVSISARGQWLVRSSQSTKLIGVRGATSGYARLGMGGSGTVNANLSADIKGNQATVNVSVNGLTSLATTGSGMVSVDSSGKNGQISAMLTGSDRRTYRMQFSFSGDVCTLNIAGDAVAISATGKAAEIYGR